MGIDSPENVGSRRRSHRKDITVASNFKNLNEVLSEEIANKIKGCYRQSYLLDCVLAADNEASFFFVLQRVKTIKFLIPFIDG